MDNLRLSRFYINNYGLISLVKHPMSLYKEKFENPCFNADRIITFDLILLFFGIIFLWDGLITQVPFDNFVFFIEGSLIKMSDIFLFQQGNSVIQFATGQSNYLGIPGRIELLLSWLIIFLTVIGVMGSILQRMRKTGFLKNPFKNIDLELLVVSFVGVSFLVISFVSPFISTGYNILRTFFQMLFFLNVFIVGAFLSLNFPEKLSKKLKLPGKLSEDMKLVFLLLVIIFYFMCTTGTMYQFFDVDRSISLNSHGKEYDDIFIHDQEIYGAKWLKNHMLENKTINTDYLGRFRVIIGGFIDPHQRSVDNNITKQYLDSYIYLRYYNVVDKRILVFNSESNITNVPLESYDYKFKGKDRIYDNDGTQIFL